jgi:23S rRNA A2030 N6-methylase RlmJ
MDKIEKLKKRVEECLNSSPVSDEAFINLGENVKRLALYLIEEELDQSQKQPEVLDFFGAEDIYTTSNTEPEKQEEWREELKGLLEIYKDKDNDADEDDIVDFISQLLSERTFNKEELEYIKGACYMWSKEVNEHNPIKEEFRDTSKIDAFNKKLSKLLER